MQFQGFKPDALKRIAGTLGYQGDMNSFEQYLMDNPDKKQTMDMYNNKAMQMAMGGAVKKFAEGGTTPTTTAADPRAIPQKYIPQTNFTP